jgi:hypothetical protein
MTVPTILINFLLNQQLAKAYSKKLLGLLIEIEENSMLKK